ncbi:MAG: nucleotidyltransferase domain-containing protein [Pleurocapsa sp. SU_196_0]|nr:nucleotidyltransferase domain-containing protein [Pleurocapsa sp. SU_196_0]
MTAQEVPDFILEIAKRAAAATGARAVYLFGSHARGEARADSDVDLLIVVDDLANLRDTGIAADRANRDRTAHVDFIAMHEGHFKRCASLIALEVARDGVILYSQPDAASSFQETTSVFMRQFMNQLEATRG